MSTSQNRSYTPSGNVVAAVREELANRFQPNGFNNLGMPSAPTQAPLGGIGFADLLPLIEATPQIVMSLGTSLSNRFGDQHQVWSQSPDQFSQQIQQTQDLLNGGTTIGQELGPVGGMMSSVGSSLFNFFTARQGNHGMEGDLTYANRLMNESKEDQRLMEVKQREADARLRAEKAIDAETHQIEGQIALVGSTGAAQEFGQSELARQALADRIANDPNFHSKGDLRAGLNESGAEYRTAENHLITRQQQQAVSDANRLHQQIGNQEFATIHAMTGDPQGAEQIQFHDQLADQRLDVAAAAPPKMRDAILRGFDDNATAQTKLLNQRQKQEHDLAGADNTLSGQQSHARADDSRAQAQEDALRASGQRYAADTAAFKRQQDEKIAALEAAPRHERDLADAITLDNDQKRQRQSEARRLDREANAVAEAAASEENSRRLQHDRDDELSASDIIKQTNIARLRSEHDEYGAILQDIDLRYDTEIEKAHELGDNKTESALSSAKSEAQADAATQAQGGIDDMNLRARSIALRAEHRAPEAALMGIQADFKKNWEASDATTIKNNYTDQTKAENASQRPQDEKNKRIADLTTEHNLELKNAPALRNAAINLARTQVHDFLLHEPRGAGEGQTRTNALAFQTLLDDSQKQARSPAEFAALGHSLRTLGLSSQSQNWKTDAQIGKENAATLSQSGEIIEKAMQKLIDGPRIFVLTD